MAAAVGVWGAFHLPEAAAGGPPVAAGAVTGAAGGAHHALVALRAPLPGGRARVALVAPGAAGSFEELAPPGDAGAGGPPAGPPGAAARAAAARVARAAKRAGRAVGRLAPDGAGVPPAAQALFNALVAAFPEAEWDGPRMVLAPGALALAPPYGAGDALVLARTPAERRGVEESVLPRARAALAHAAGAVAARAAAAAAAAAAAGSPVGLPAR